MQFKTLFNFPIKSSIELLYLVCFECVYKMHFKEIGNVFSNIQGFFRNLPLQSFFQSSKILFWHFNFHNYLCLTPQGSFILKSTLTWVFFIPLEPGTWNHISQYFLVLLNIRNWKYGVLLVLSLFSYIYLRNKFCQ